MRAAAIIVAAGRGERTGGAVPKQYTRLDGRPLLCWSVDAFHAAGIADIVVVIAREHAERFAALGLKGVQAVVGGAVRTASVRAGLDALAAVLPDIVMIHDAARPGLSPPLIAALRAAIAAGADGVAPAVPVADSLRVVHGANIIAGEVERIGVVQVQTPQAFRYGAIRDAYAALAPDAALSDDLAVARQAGLKLVTVRGDPALMKLTYPEDIAMLERILAAPRETVTAAGFDAHRFGLGDHVMLCGVRVPHDKGLLGHSDADAGWHALVDAILGALGAGDIGVHFPPSDPQWKGANSELFLRHAAKLAREADARIVHVDITLICERPKVAPHRGAMRTRTAEALGIGVERVSVKATTTEGLGFLGREEGVAAQAMATLSRRV